MSRRVAIVGGGISGLAAAYFLSQQPDVQVTVLERDSRWGGKVQTERVGGLIMEGGPDSFLLRRPNAAELCRALGLGGELVQMQPGLHASLLHRGKLHGMPEGLLLGVPTKIGPFVGTPLLSPLGKLRAGLDLVLPRRAETGDEALGHFLARRLGHEVLHNLADPLLGGIYAGDPAQLSLQATFPNLQELEQGHRSLILGLLAQRRAAPARPAGAPPESVFGTLRGGLGQLIEALVGHLSRRVSLRPDAGVAQLRRSGGAFTLALAGGEALTADAVLLTTPAYAAAELVTDLAPAAAEQMRTIPYVSVATVALAYPMQALRQPLQGTGFVVPRGEDVAITAATYVSNKWPHAADPGHMLVRCFVGRSGDEGIVHQPDDVIISAARHAVEKLAGLRGEPELVRLVRWPRSMPQYIVGHLDRLARLDAALAQVPGLHVCGAAYRGLGLPDCIKQAQAAAERILSAVPAPA